MTETAESEAYAGLPGAFPYAFRHSSSLLFKLYVLVGTLLALAIGLLFSFALIVLIADTAGAAGAAGSLSLSRSFFVVVGLLVVLPILAPILLVARRRRHAAARGERNGGGRPAEPRDGRYERRLALAGFAFLCSIYLALVISVPPEHQTYEGALGPVVSVLFALPAIAALAPPVLATALIYATHRVSR